MHKNAYIASIKISLVSVWTSVSNALVSIQQVHTLTFNPPQDNLVCSEKFSCPRLVLLVTLVWTLLDITGRGVVTLVTVSHLYAHHMLYYNANDLHNGHG